MDELIAVAVISRHGARAPFVSYPSDPHPCNDTSVWPNGPGQLTDDGKKMMRRLGERISERYSSLIQEPNVKITSKVSGPQRCYDSMESMISGMCLEKRIEIQVDNGMLNWEPTDEDEDSDIKTLFENICNNLLESFPKQHPLVAQELERRGIVFQTGFDIIMFADVLNTQAETGKSPPDWIDDQMKQVLVDCYFDSIDLAANTRMCDWSIRKLFEELEREFTDAVDNNSYKLLLYNTHDVNIYYMLHSLTSSAGKNDVPKFCASITLELHRNPTTDTHFVKAFFWNNVKDEPFPGKQKYDKM